jgi:hypothetical protein
MATNAPARPLASRPIARRGFSLPNWVYGIGVGVLLMVFLFVVTLMFGRIGGEEFSPHDFKRRTFHYYEIPLLRIQVWPIKRFDSTGDLEAQLVKDKLIPSKTPDEPRWDLIHGYRGATPVAEGDAHFLTRYLEMKEPVTAAKNAGSLTWLVWTKDHPELAKIFWPTIAKLAEQELYIFTPDLFLAAAAANDAQEFEQTLQQILAAKYHDFGLAQQQLNHHEAAVELLQEAVKLAPERKDWQEELAEAKQAAEANKAAAK